MPRVSCILTVYNAGQYLEQAVNSVLEQTFDDWELLVLDDGSTDQQALNVLQAVAVSGQNVKIVSFSPTDTERAATVRYATLINWGVAHTTGEYIVCLPGDDYFEPDAFERMVAAAANVSSPVYGGQELIWEGSPDFAYRRADEPLADAWHRVDMSQVMVRRTVFDEVGGWQDTPATPELWRCADGAFWRRLTDAGYIFEPVPGGPVSVKRYRDDSVNGRVIAGKTPW